MNKDRVLGLDGTERACPIAHYRVQSEVHASSTRAIANNYPPPETKRSLTPHRTPVSAVRNTPHRPA
ncbi:hypothetical protein [Zwartia sp.]|uniref:hypothetical protein n=1 Tax=Zwartia sp. TaxID=2978004 RepID=UPI0028B23EB7|nr:hypothetical protein [Zwartia sp.]